MSQQSAQSSYRRVGAPDVDVGVGDDLAGLVVDDLDGQRHLDTGQAFGDILADLLATDVWKCQHRLPPLGAFDIHSGPSST